MGVATIPSASSAPTTQMPIGASAVLFDGVLKTVFKATKSTAVPAGAHLCVSSAPLLVTTPLGNAVTSISPNTPTLLQVPATDTSITVQAGSQPLAFVNKTLPSATWHQVAFGNGVFLAVASAGSTVSATSTDGGLTWTARTLPAANQSGQVAFGNGVFMVVDYVANQAYTSPDGITWTAKGSASVSNVLFITFAGGYFWGCLNSAATTVKRSTDGVVWTVASFTSLLWSKVVYGNGIYMLLNNSASQTFMQMSYDGTNWFPTGTFTSSLATALIFHNGKFFLYGPNVSSVDGLTWTALPAIQGPGPGNLNQDIYSYAGVIYCAANSGTTGISTSLDGVNFTSRPAATAQNWISAAVDTSGNVVCVSSNAANTVCQQSPGTAINSQVDFGIYAAPATIY